MPGPFAPYGPDFGRLRTTLLGGKADRVPLMELGIDEGVMGRFLGRPVQNLQDKIDFYRLAGYDYIKLAPVIDMNPGAAVPQEGRRHSEATDLDRARNWGTESKGVITSWEEFERFQWAEVTDAAFRWFDEAEKIMPTEMRVIGQYGDIFTFTWEFMGFETFSYALVEDPALVEAVFERVGSIIFALFERMAQYETVGGLFYSDDIAYFSGLMISPPTLRRYLFPWMKKIGDLCRSRQRPCLYHSDGRLWEVIEELIGLGVTTLHPIEPKAMEIREVQAAFGPRRGLIGSVDMDLLARGEPDAIRSTVRSLIEEVGQRGGYCVGSGNSIPNYIPVNNFRAMLETTWEFGRL